MELWYLTYVRRTPDFGGIPNLERFKLHSSPYLEMIDSLFGVLEKLVFVSIEWCGKIKIFSSINRLKNIETLSFEGCKPRHWLVESGETRVQKLGEDLVDVKEGCLEKPSSSHNNMKHPRLWVSHTNLTKLKLGYCGLGDKNIGSFDWELPSLKELDLHRNDFSRLDFSLLGLPKLKWFDVTSCESLVELKDLPSSISVIHANFCNSLTRFGDTSNCKWLWKVSNTGMRKLDPYDGVRLLKSMLKGNAIEDHNISVSIPHQIPMGFQGSFFKGETFVLWYDTPILQFHSKTLTHSNTFTLGLRDNWDNDFCGLLMRVATHDQHMTMHINITKHESDKEYDYVFLKDSDKEPEPEYDEEVRTNVGYVSFSSLKQTTSLNSSYSTISFSIYSYMTSFTAELVPRKNKDDPLQTTKGATKCPEFWDEKDGYTTSFVIEHESKSFVKIRWTP